MIAIYALIGLSLVVLTGWAGQVSLGQMAFVGFGSALAGEMAARWHVDTGLILLASGALGAVLAVIVGMPTLRARGLAFAVVTLAFALATSDFLLNTGYSPLQSWLPQDVIDRTHLLGVIPLGTDKEFYILSVVVLGLAIVGGARLAREPNRAGPDRRARQRARDRGVRHPGARTRSMLAFAISGFLAGVAGALFVLQQQLLVSQTFTPDVSLRIFAMVVVGGLGSISGAVLGAAFVYGVQYFLPSEYAFLATGAGLLLVLLLVPGGLGALFGDARDGDAAVVRPPQGDPRPEPARRHPRRGRRFPSAPLEALNEATRSRPARGAAAVHEPQAQTAGADRSSRPRRRTGDRGPEVVAA